MPIPLLDDLRGRGFRGEILAEAPLAPFTTWRIGGPAEVLATAAAPEDVELAVRFAVDRAIPWRVLGNGSNLLVRDEGVRGLVLRVRKALDGVAVDGGVIVAGAGASFPSVARAAAEHGLAGLEFGAGIPGTVGGAIVMNAGWHEFETGSRVAEVEFLEPDGLVVSYPARACRFGYRTSAFRTRRGVVLRAGFVLEPDEPLAVAVRLGLPEARGGLRRTPHRGRGSQGTPDRGRPGLAEARELLRQPRQGQRQGRLGARRAGRGGGRADLGSQARPRVRAVVIGDILLFPS